MQIPLENTHKYTIMNNLFLQLRISSYKIYKHRQNPCLNHSNGVGVCRSCIVSDVIVEWLVTS